MTQTSNCCCSIVTTPASLASVESVLSAPIMSNCASSVVKQLWFIGENMSLETGTVVIYNDLPNVIEEITVCPTSMRSLYKLKQLVQEPKTSIIHCDKLKPFKRRSKLWDGQNVEDLRVGYLLDYKGDSAQWYGAEVLARGEKDFKTNQETCTIKCFGLQRLPFNQTVMLKDVVDQQKFAAFASQSTVKNVPAAYIFDALAPQVMENGHVSYKSSDALDDDGCPSWKLGRVVSVFESDGQVYFVRVFDSVNMSFHWLEYKVCYCHDAYPNRKSLYCGCGGTIRNFSTNVNHKLDRVALQVNENDFYFAVFWILFCVVIVVSFVILIHQFSKINQSIESLKHAALATSSEVIDVISSISSSFLKFKNEQEMLYSSSFLEFRAQQEATHSCRKPFVDLLSRISIVLFNAPWLWMVNVFCFVFTCASIVWDSVAFLARFLRS